MSIKRSVVFPESLYEEINKEANRQNISFNKLVSEIVAGQINPDFEKDTISNLTAPVISESENDVDKEIKLHLKQSEIDNLKQLASEAGLTLVGLIRRFAKYGKIEVKEVNLGFNLNEWSDEIYPLVEDLHYLINTADLTTLNEEIANDLRYKANVLISEYQELKKNMYRIEKRINKKIEKGV